MAAEGGSQGVELRTAQVESGQVKKRVALRDETKYQQKQSVQGFRPENCPVQWAQDRQLSSGDVLPQTTTDGCQIHFSKVSFLMYLVMLSLKASLKVDMPIACP